MPIIPPRVWQCSRQRDSYDAIQFSHNQGNSLKKSEVMIGLRVREQNGAVTWAVLAEMSLPFGLRGADPLTLQQP